MYQWNIIVSVKFNIFERRKFKHIIFFKKCFYLFKSSFQAGYCSSERNPKIPKVHGVAHQEIAVPASGSWNRSGFQDRSALSERRYRCPPGSVGSLPGRPVRRHEFVRHSRQTCHDHAKRYTTGTANSRWTRLNRSQTIYRAFSFYYYLDIVCF